MNNLSFSGILEKIKSNIVPIFTVISTIGGIFYSSYLWVNDNIATKNDLFKISCSISKIEKALVSQDIERWRGDIREVQKPGKILSDFEARRVDELNELIAQSRQQIYFITVERKECPN